MREQSPEVRSLFEDLRSVDPVTPDSLDDAWDRFESRAVPSRRRWPAPTAAFALMAAAIAIGWFAFPEGTGLEQRAREQSTATAVFGAAPRHTLDMVRAESKTASDPEPAAGLPGGADLLGPAVDDPMPDAVPSHADPEPGARKSTRPSRSDAAISESKRTLKEELLLLDEAERAFRGGDLATARRIVDEHAERFPDAVLARERRVLRSKVDEANATIRTPK